MQLLNDAGKEIFKNGLVSVTKRDAVPPVSCNTYLPPINTWVAPHDIKDYGDTDESIYRRFFRFGYIRIELALPDIKRKEISKKVYYIPDPNVLEHKYVNKYITIRYFF